MALPSELLNLKKGRRLFLSLNTYSKLEGDFNLFVPGGICLSNIFNVAEGIKYSGQEIIPLEEILSIGYLCNDESGEIEKQAIETEEKTITTVNKANSLNGHSQKPKTIEQVDHKKRQQQQQLLSDIKNCDASYDYIREKNIDFHKAIDKIYNSQVVGCIFDFNDKARLSTLAVSTNLNAKVFLFDIYQLKEIPNELICLLQCRRPRKCLHLTAELQMQLQKLNLKISNAYDTHKLCAKIRAQHELDTNQETNQQRLLTIFETQFGKLESTGSFHNKYMERRRNLSQKAVQLLKWNEWLLLQNLSFGQQCTNFSKSIYEKPDLYLDDAFFFSPHTIGFERIHLPEKIKSNGL